MQEQILIVEDDKSVADGLKDILLYQGYRVLLAENNADAMDAIKTGQVHLVILDVHLGTDNGFDFCREMRKTWDIPVLFLTACNSEMELIRGFQAGGDDYVTKPFRVQELVLRIRALLRRRVQEPAGSVKSGELVCDRQLCQVRKDGILMDLTATEWKLVSALMSHWPDTVAREELIYLVWDREALFVEENTLNVNISRLREKLGVFEGRTYIETVRGVGYRWAVPVGR